MSSPIPITAEQLWQYPDHDQLELVAGQLHVSEPPGGSHGQVAVRLAYRLHGYVESHRLGAVLAETGYILRRGPDTVRGPDLSFVAAASLDPDRMPATFLPTGPDLAVEILSPDDRPGSVAAKIDDYLTGGTKLVWVIDPVQRRVSVHRADGSVTRLGADGLLEGEMVVPGFRCPIAEVLPKLGWQGGTPSGGSIE